MRDTAGTSSHGSSIAVTPEPPYVAVIFTSRRTPDDNGYASTAAAMLGLAQEQPGYLGVESVRENDGITVSYWQDETAARSWKDVAEHLVAQRQGRDVCAATTGCRRSPTWTTSINGQIHSRGSPWRSGLDSRCTEYCCRERFWRVNLHSRKQVLVHRQGRAGTGAEPRGVGDGRHVSEDTP